MSHVYQRSDVVNHGSRSPLPYTILFSHLLRITQSQCCLPHRFLGNRILALFAPH